MSVMAEPRVRRGMSWAALALGALWVVLGIVEAFTADPRNSEGWGGGVAMVIFVAGPLLGVGWALRSTEPRVLRATAVVSGVLAVVVALVLVAQILDPIEDEARAVLVQVPAILVYVGACLTAVDAVRRR